MTTTGSPALRSAEVPVRWRKYTDPFVLTVLSVYLAARAFSALLLVVLTRYQVAVSWTGPEVNYGTIVGLWDAGWYQEIATKGYPGTLPRDPDTGELQQNPWAFYPLFPMMTRLLMAVTGAPFPITGAVLAFVLGGVAAVAMAFLLRDRIGSGSAVAAVAVWSTCAPSPVLQVAYTESLAILLLVLVLSHLDQERWWWAAGTAFLTGLARPIAVPLGLVAVVAVVMRWRARSVRPIPREEYIGMAGALGGCGLAGLTWPMIAWWGTGIRTAYTDTMATWRQGQDIVPLQPWVGISHYLFGQAGPLALAALVVLVVGVASGPWASRLGPVMRAWILAYPLYLAVVLDPGTSVFRYLLPCFPWAAIAVDAAWRGRRRRRLEERATAAEGPGTAGYGESIVETRTPSRLRLWSLTAGWVLFGLATQWWWLYELWRFVPPSDFPP
ncbi:hypothetical protein SAMN05421595_0758 [Austwickia chelonae]|uniref:Glycosyltransferase RgtA/B/C/D-like domain-containing protein n=1 Tax=Austwickia chelonae NBRC 105200 TaxID=1184607 RepID=K6W8U0_9MICO|nr:hypothetical protein [Austwickia chelonae]GAB78242.1 hypothetical protein AUCHE_08_04880 [Austwickia chelonae NBRC 105200]SEV99462.1 hypothetical protein SAMN05421595_0758 [Austwickia chelonae]